VSDIFRKFSRTASVVLGSPWAFMLAAASIVVWAITGPLYHFSNTWQLIANTGTTLITFLMVFVIQNTQNRDGKAIQLKLDELLQGVQGARTGLVDLEDMDDNDLDTLQKQFAALHVRLSDLGAATVEGETVEAGTVKADHIEATVGAEPVEAAARYRY
jgi:low affinity Fe/Cu permease